MKAVLWDLDGTLVDSEPAHAAAFDAALAALGLAVPPEFHVRLLGASEDMVHKALVAETAATIDLAAWRTVKWRHYRTEAARIALLPSAALLRPLANAGVAMAVVSNSTRAEVDLNLSAVGLGDVFPVTISRNDVGRGKPDPEGYLAAARLLGVDPGACVVVEDSPTGAAAGLAAGMTTVFHPQLPDLVAPAGALAVAAEGIAAVLAGLGLPTPGPAKATPPTGRNECSPRA